MFKNFLVAGIAIVSFVTFSSPSAAGPCGGTIACSCGDTVESDRNLTSADSVLNSVCPADGLIMNTSGVRLNLRGSRIRGDGGAGDTGILILIGVNNVEILDGDIRTFGTGIKSEGTTTGSSIIEIAVKSSTGNGIDVAGDNNRFENNRNLSGNGGDGMVVTGDHNVVTLNRAVLNKGDGIVVNGSSNDISEKNQAVKNEGNGITVVGDDNDLDNNNQIHHNRGHGIRVIGTGNFLRRNATNRDALVGILVTGGGNIDGGGNNHNQGPQRVTNGECEIDGNACLP